MIMENWHLYRKPDGCPDLSTHKLSLDIFPGYRLVSVSTTKPDIAGKVFDAHDRLIPIDRGYAYNRRAAYPAIGDQLDALWKAIGTSLDSPEAIAMLEKIQAVKDEFPKLVK